MGNIRNIAFDLGGVVLSLNLEGSIRAFEKIGLADARQRLDAFIQRGIFADLESGAISNREFCKALGDIIGRPLTMQECFDAWHGYVGCVPRRNLDALLRLRSEGYKVCLLSNTNPFMMQWADSPAFDGEGHPVSYYFDKMYLSYECRAMKPSEEIFRMMLDGQQSTAGETLFIDDSPANVAAAQALGIETICPHNNEDWTGMLFNRLAE